MTEKEIRKAFIDHDVSNAIIARQLNVSANAVSLVLQRKQKSTRIATAIAKAIGKSLKEVFPRYHIRGEM